MPRPKEFDPETALDRAMHLFWEKGYEATSVQNLVDRTGINRASLYGTFGDKHALFLAACDRYGAVVVSERLEALERSRAGLGAIRAFFMGLVEALVSDSGRRGCLMTNSTVEAAPRDAQIGDRARAHLARMDLAFYSALRRATERGEIGGRRNLQQYARYLTSSAQGLAVIGRLSSDRAGLQGIIRTVLSALR